MKLYLGALKNPMRLVTNFGLLRVADNVHPVETTRSVQRLWGLSLGQTFIGVMICDIQK